MRSNRFYLLFLQTLARHKILMDFNIKNLFDIDIVLGHSVDRLGDNTACRILNRKNTEVYRSRFQRRKHVLYRDKVNELAFLELAILNVFFCGLLRETALCAGYANSHAVFFLGIRSPLKRTAYFLFGLYKPVENILAVRIIPEHIAE